MNLKENIQEAKRLALKGGDKESNTVLGFLLGEIERYEPGPKGTPLVIIEGVKIVPDDIIIKIIKKAIANNIIAETTDENHILETYLPKMLSQEETQFAVQNVIDDLGVTTKADMGKVMGEMNRQFGSTIDGKVTSNIVKSILK